MSALNNSLMKSSYKDKNGEGDMRGKALCFILWFVRSLLVLLAIYGSAESLRNHVEDEIVLLPTEEELHQLEEHVPKVVLVRPNKLGAERSRRHNSLNSVDATAEDEFVMELVTGKEAVNNMGDNPHLPPFVDNSQLPSFPPIANQGSLSSCVAWATTYYQGSHEIGLLNGKNNKNSLNDVLSPKWTYTFINGGMDTGSSVFAAYELLSMQGAPSIVNFPNDNDFLAWDVNPQDWISALRNRMTNYQAIPGLGGDGPQNLTAIKNTLNNGHIVTFATYIDSWVYTKIGQDPENPNSPYEGQDAAVWMNGRGGGHLTTIVGYNDDLWIDVNRNGQVDPGERGAFLVANSWGPSWGNSGFIWISYDAFLAKSAVENGPNHGRVAAGEPINSYVLASVPKAANYSPTLIAEFTLMQNARNEILVKVGVSELNEMAPSKYFTIPALSNQGGSYDFDGKKSTHPDIATFVVDLTDLMKSFAKQRFYLSVTDSATGNPTTLNSFFLIDLMHDKKVGSPISPMMYDHSTGINYIDYDLSTGM